MEPSTKGAVGNWESREDFYWAALFMRRHQGKIIMVEQELIFAKLFAQNRPASLRDGTGSSGVAI